jgi:hypothetical protein
MKTQNAIRKSNYEPFNEQNMFKSHLKLQKSIEFEEFEGFEFGDGFDAFHDEFVERYSH